MHTPSKNMLAGSLVRLPETTRPKENQACTHLSVRKEIVVLEHFVDISYISTRYIHSIYLKWGDCPRPLN